MMAPEVYERARETAPVHVQLLVLRVRLQGGSAQVHGRAMRVFRGWRQGVWPGRALDFSIPVIAPAEVRGPPCPSGEISYDWGAFARAHWLEAFLWRDGQRFNLVRDQVAPIRGPTLSPVCHKRIRGFVCPGNLGA